MFINSDSLKKTTKWIRTSLDYISSGVVLLGVLYELQAGRTDPLTFCSMFELRMQFGKLRPFDYLFANASLYLILRIIGLA